MPSSTPNRGYPYPLGTDQIQVPEDIQALAMAVDADVDTLTAADPSTSTAGIIGEIRMFGGTTPPTTWLLCQGQAISRSAYAALFAVYSTRFGAGDGSTTFNLPNFQATVPVGVNSGVNPPSGVAGFAALGGRGGVKDQIVVAHQHVAPDHLHGPGNLKTNTDSVNHTHTLTDIGEVVRHNPYAPTGRLQIVASGGLPVDLWNVNGRKTIGHSVAHTHQAASGTVAGADRVLTTTSTGASGTNGNYPPAVAIHFMVKAL